MVVGFGTVSLAADMVYEGARSVYGPLLASLGASALVVGAVTGAGEAAALVLRLVSGPLADRTRRYWTLTTAGYAMTAVCVPLLGVTPLLGSAGLAVAASLILLERISKAVRSPAKSALLAEAASYPARLAHPTVRQPLPRAFLRFAVGTGLCTAGLLTFGVIGFHLVARDLVPVAGVPLLYAGAMAAGAVAALLTGELYDRIGPRVLLALPLLVAVVPPLALTERLGTVIVGVVVWGMAVGVQDSTVKALVAELVPRDRRATAYGVFAAVQGTGALVGGVGAGALYEQSIALLIGVTAVVQLVALALTITVVRWHAGAPRK